MSMNIKHLKPFNDPMLTLYMSIVCDETVLKKLTMNTHVQTISIGTQIEHRIQVKALDGLAVADDIMLII